MYFLLSPAKKLSEKRDYPATAATTFPFPEETAQLVGILQQKAPQDLAELMGISDKLALLNTARFAEMVFPADKSKLFPAVFLFNGDAYEGLDARSLDGGALSYLQKSLGLLSGLYGLLRPFDHIYPYRLEMGTALQTPSGSRLYDFWQDKITQLLAQRMREAGAQTLINLASQEYFQAVRPEKLPAKTITPVFKEYRGGKYKIISFYAKRARGLMVRFAAENTLSRPEDLQHFDSEGYRFQAALSDETRWVFTRESSGSLKTGENA